MLNKELIDFGRAQMHQNFSLRPTVFFMNSVILLSLMCLSYYLGYQRQHSEWSQSAIARQIDDIQAQTQDVAQAKEDALKSMSLLSQKVGNLQQQLALLQALGNSIAKQSDLAEVSFSDDTNQQLPEGALYEASIPDFIQQLDTLQRELKTSNTTMLAILDLVQQKDLVSARVPSIMPIKAYVSSWFGWRNDPMRKYKRKTFHEGMDFSADLGTSIKSTAAGVITWSGPRDNYGNLVEIDHGNGYITRYAHIDQLYVRVGERVQKGQLIASVGNTGRTTGPHLHYEVEKDGSYRDPKEYMSLN